MKIPGAEGPAAAGLRRKREQVLARLRLPTEALSGSLALSKRRCGKSTCHCADGEGHAVWSLTFMAEGKKRVEHIPMDWVDEVRPRVEAGREFKEAVAKLFITNADLLVLARNQRRRPKSAGARKKKQPK